MGEGYGQTLTRKIGPLPTWIWFIIFVGVLYFYLHYRQSKQASTQGNTQGLGNSSSSNLGTVPVSNLSTAAQPMPIQMGDTFINNNMPSSTETGNWTTEPLKCAGNGAQRLLCRKAINQQRTLQAASPPQPSPATQIVNPQPQNMKVA